MDKKVELIISELEKMFPEAKSELVFQTPFEVLVSVILSAQCTDKRVNEVTSEMYKKYNKPEDFADMPLEQLENLIHSCGFYHNKALAIKNASREILEKFNSKVPSNFDDLCSLPGVGRKTANVVLSVAFGVPAIAVDTHVQRVSRRLKFCRQKDSVRQVEETLMQKIPPERWSQAHHQLIFFGRYFCKAQRPNCTECPFQNDCTTGKKTL